MIQELPFDVSDSGSAKKTKPNVTPPFPTTPLTRGVSKSMETLHDSGHSSSAASPVIIGLNNDIVHLVEMVDGIKYVVDNILARVQAVEDHQAGLAPLISGVAEGLGALGRSVASKAQEQQTLGQAITCAVHELGGDLPSATIFPSPLPPGNSIAAPTVACRVIIISLFLSIFSFILTYSPFTLTL